MVHQLATVHFDGAIRARRVGHHKLIAVALKERDLGNTVLMDDELLCRDLFLPAKQPRTGYFSEAKEWGS